MKKDKMEITTECGVDIRLVDPSTGKVVVAENSEFKRTDTAGGMGIAILGANAHSDNSLQISEDDKGKILRLALDDALRKALPDIDNFLRHQPAASGGPASSAPRAPSQGGGASTPAPAGETAAKRFCPECGKPVPAGVKFCPNCGHKME